MSIPKEPRALMINLMYLVLTAMLALNVSAEIINAFFMIDKSIRETNKIVQTSGTQVIEAMKETIETKKEYAPLIPLAEQAQKLSNEFVDYVESLRTAIVDGSGGLYPEDYEDPKKAGKPKGYKDIDVTQRLFVDEGKGAELKERLGELKGKYRNLLEEIEKAKIKGVLFDNTVIERIMSKLPMEVDEESWKSSDKNSWEAYTFGYMPVAAVYPLLTKFQNDARTSEALIINEMAGLIGKTSLVFDKFDVFSSSLKPYILLGESFEAEIALGAFSSQAKFSVSVNGSNIPVNADGVANYKVTPNKVGEQSYRARVNLTNPLTGETEVTEKEFKFEVGQPSVTISLDKMNVFYIGVDNPITIAAAGVSTNNLGVSINGGGAKLTPKSKTSYVVNATQQTNDCTITLTDRGAGKSYPFKYRVKRIPDPTVKFGGKISGTMGNGQVKAQVALNADLENFDFEARCDVQSYELIRLPRRDEPELQAGTGARFPPNVQALLGKAKPGDTYTFMNMKVKCPGDVAGRPVPAPSIIVQ